MIGVQQAARQLYGRVLMVLLFPFVFLFTAYEMAPRQCRAVAAKGSAIFGLMSLGLTGVHVIRILY